MDITELRGLQYSMWKSYWRLMNVNPTNDLHTQFLFYQQALEILEQIFLTEWNISKVTGILNSPKFIIMQKELSWLKDKIKKFDGFFR